MNYFNQFQKHIANHDYSSFLTLWEEYCLGDEIEPQELKQILISVKNSGLAEPFGRHVEQILDLWKTIEDKAFSHLIFKLIIDLETTNHLELGEFILKYLKQRYSDDPHFNEKIRLIGLREMHNFQGSISNFELLTHMKKGNYVFHSAGWGVGEIMEVSFLREQLNLEFDYIAGSKDLSFQNAFKTLIPLPDDHFLARRFGDPDKLEEDAKNDPSQIIHILLRDLGPKTASEIKEELCELVIPAHEWTRWWQTTRGKLKKDTMIELPSDLKEPFCLRETEIPHEERLQKSLEKKPDAKTLIVMVYSFLRDFPTTLKNEEFRLSLQEKLKEALSYQELTDAQELQIHFFLEDLMMGKEYAPVKELIQRFTSVEDVIEKIDVIAFRKRALVEVRNHREDWSPIFLNLLLSIDQIPIRDYILTELLKAKKEEEVTTKLEELITFPSRHPNAFLWYIQKIMKKTSYPFANQEGKNRFFESFLILLSMLEKIEGKKELIKKMHQFILAGRFANVRKIFKNASEEVVHEFLLLATKCTSLDKHDIQILHSLAEVVHPSLKTLSKKYEPSVEEEEIIWTTEEGYQQVKKRIEQIATVETVENAKEIEVARSHGDLRENAEFKFALEKRDRLQSEIKRLSDQINKARILSKIDVDPSKITVGVIVDCKNKSGEKVSYTLLGPWDADPDKNILSFQSKLAQDLMGHKEGEVIKIQDDEISILKIRNFFD